MRIGFFGNSWQPALLVLWLAESGAVLAASRLGVQLAGGPSVDPKIYWMQAVVFGGCVILAMVAMGLFTRRMRDRMAGIVLRISLSVVAGGVLSGLLLAIWPKWRFSFPGFVSAIRVVSASMRTR